MTAERGEERRFRAAPGEEGVRLDMFLADRCPDLSRSRIHTEMEAGRVLVDGRPRPKSFKLKSGSEVVFRPEPKPAMEAVPQDIPLDIVFEDEHLLVLDKPAGLVVHPAAGHPDGTLVNALLHHCGRLAAGDDPLRPGLVHRLDRDTSGLMAVALDDAAHRHLTGQLQTRSMGRTYHTLSWGRWNEDAGTLTGDIGRDPRQRQRMGVVSRGGRPAETRYVVLEDFGFVQHCRVELATGRTHQIRVHFAHHRHPVVGDSLYGDDGRRRGVHNLDRARADRMVRSARRQMLHASELRLVHPVTAAELVFRSELPADMARVLEDLRRE
jgi:23S rRNA pseudouridine1911/1915/1917 synthase